MLSEGLLLKSQTSQSEIGRKALMNMLINSPKKVNRPSKNSALSLLIKELVPAFRTKKNEWLAILSTDLTLTVEEVIRTLGCCLFAVR